MEILWIIPLYIICPLIGILLTINACIKLRERRGRLFFGISLILSPVMHMFLIKGIELSLKNNIVGHYKLRNRANILIINDNGTFTLNQTIQLNVFGSGKWELLHGDTDELNLKFENHDDDWLLLEVIKDGKRIELRTNPPSDEQTAILIKE
jgi:hypothetical protein